MRPPLLLAVALLTITPLLANDPKPTATPATQSDVDVAGIAFGLPFGAPEKDITAKFGSPTGTLRLDDKRSFLIYGRSFAFLIYEGTLDGVRMERDLFMFALCNEIPRVPPFLFEGWTLSNGLYQDMYLQEVANLLKIPVPSIDRYNLFVPLDQTNLELNFSSVGNERHFNLRGYLLVRRHGETDHWTQAAVRKATHPLRGKKLIGIGVTPTRKGLYITSYHEGGPSDLAGLKYGDIIEKINGQSTIGMGAVEFDRIIAEKDPNELTIIPEDKSPTRTISISTVEGSTLASRSIGRSLPPLKVAVGDQAPDFTATAPDGKKTSLSDLRGRLVLLNFTATWCAPDQMEAPKLKAAYKAFHDRGFDIVSVYLDQPDKDVMAQARSLGITWPIHTDGRQWDNEVARAYGVTAIPTNLLIAPSGRILSTNTSAEILEQTVPRHLPSTP